MAVIERGSTKKVSALIRYCFKENSLVSAHNLLSDSREEIRREMMGTRNMHGKNHGLQGHHVIQSFAPGEVSPDEANQIGRELAISLFADHEVVIVTHTDRDHIHNHLIINAVSFDNGQKLHASKASLHQWKEASDALCREHGLSVIEKDRSRNRNRRTMAEDGMRRKRREGRRSEPVWKDQLRATIREAWERNRQLDDVRDYLEKRGVKSELKYFKGAPDIKYHHPQAQRAVFGHTLGDDYSLVGQVRRQQEMDQEMSQKPERRMER